MSDDLTDDFDFDLDLDEAPEPEAATPAPGPPTPEEVADALGVDEVDHYGAEKAAQASVCHLPAPGEEWPTELREALILRVAAAAVHGPRRGSTDPEVMRLEAPHRKRVPATLAEPN